MIFKFNKQQNSHILFKHGNSETSKLKFYKLAERGGFEPPTRING